MTEKRCKDHLDPEPILIVNPVGSKHYGKWVCPVCKRWINHARQPKTTAEMEERQEKIRYLILNNCIEDEAELHKLLLLYNLTHLNLIQQPIYEKAVQQI